MCKLISKNIVFIKLVFNKQQEFLEKYLQCSKYLVKFQAS